MNMEFLILAWFPLYVLSAKFMKWVPEANILAKICVSSKRVFCSFYLHLA